jgi:ribose 5-phosphate isomerase A
VKSGMVVGLGTGYASGLAIAYIGEKFRNGSLRDIFCVPM